MYRRGRYGGPPTVCICPICGYRIVKTRRNRCRNIRCPYCHLPLIRG